MITIERTRYSSKIIKAGALLTDTKTLLVEWDTACSVVDNLERFQRENVFGKTSRSRIEDMLVIFRQRYLRDEEMLRALVTLARAPLPAQSLDRILYLLALRSDTLLHDAVVDFLKPAYDRGQQDITIDEMKRWVSAHVVAGRTERTWSPITIERVAQSIMATLRDFGVLEGVMHKRVTPPFVPVDAFSFMTLLRYRELQSGERLLHDPEWQVFFMSPLVVERMLVAAHQEHFLEYYAAGQVIRIEFPTASLEEYAHDIAQRTYPDA